MTVTSLYEFSKLTFYKRISKFFFWFLVFSTITLTVTTLYLFLIGSFESDFQQQGHFRFLFLHVSSAWYAIVIYIIVSITSVFYLIFKYPLIYFIAKLLNNIGILFATLTIISGIFWSLPTWGSSFILDARLVSFGFLWLTYFCYWIIGSTRVNDSFDALHGSFAASLISIIGLFNIPLMKFSVEWWNTIHQTESITYDNNTIYIVNIVRLLLLVFLFLFYNLTVFFLTFRNLVIERKVYSLMYKF